MQLLRGIVAGLLTLLFLGAALFFSFFVLVAALAVALPVGLAIYFFTKRKLRQAEEEVETRHREDQRFFEDDTGVVHDVEDVEVVIEDQNDPR